MAKKVGKSRSTVTEALSIASLPEEIREQCRQADINVKSLLLQIVRQPDIPSMQSLIREVSERGLNRDEARAVRRARQNNEEPPRKAPQPYVFRYNPPGSGVKLEMRFRQPEVGRKDLIKALRNVLETLEREEAE